jgi:soluble lytic murein transglycosylase-like protein
MSNRRGCQPDNSIDSCKGVTDKAGMSFRHPLSILALAGGIVASLPALAANPCTSSIQEAERNHRIPPGLLQAMALLESGVNGQPYPWAISLSGRVVYAKSQDAAQKLLGERHASGRKNLYAGCLQLSVKYHRANFGSISDMLTPQRNVSYAARYLAGHYEDYGDWPAAVRRYNGGNPRQAAAYYCRVWRILGEIKPETAREIDNGRCGGPRAEIARWPEPAPPPEPAPEQPAQLPTEPSLDGLRG